MNVVQMTYCCHFNNLSSCSPSQSLGSHLLSEVLLLAMAL